MTNQKYNGWSNRETWVINLWSGDFLQDTTNDILSMNREISLIDLSENLEQNFLEYYDEELENMSGVLKDLLYIDSVNWIELANTYYNEWLENQNRIDE